MADLNRRLLPCEGSTLAAELIALFGSKIYSDSSDVARGGSAVVRTRSARAGEGVAVGMSPGAGSGWIGFSPSIQAGSPALISPAFASR